MSRTFVWPVRVYYEDTDTGGIVFYANYLKFFERARTEWLRTGGIDQSTLAASSGIMFVVTHTAVDYHAPARLDNELKLSVTVEKLGRASVVFLQQAWRVDRVGTVVEDDPMPGSPVASGSTLVATGRIKVACVSQQDLKPCPIPREVMHFMLGSA